MTDCSRRTAYRFDETTNHKAQGLPSQHNLYPPIIIPKATARIASETPPPRYSLPRTTARGSFSLGLGASLTSEHLRSQSKSVIQDISRPYASRPLQRRKSGRAVGRPSPLILTRSRSRQNLKAAYLSISSPPPPTPPIKRRPVQIFVPEPTSSYTIELDLPEGQSHLMSSPRMQDLVTESYAEFKSRRRVSRKSNSFLRSSGASELLTGMAKEVNLRPIPTLPLISDSTDVGRPTSEESSLPMSMSESALLIDPAVLPQPKRANESRYLRNAPPPLQLKSSAHRRPSKRSSHRFSRDTRVSMQTIDSSLFPLSPLTPRPRMPSKKEQQRRRMLKLKRTLGEDVPLEFITPPPSSGFSAMVMRDLWSDIDAVDESEKRPRHPAVNLFLPAEKKTTTKGAFGAMRKKKATDLRRSLVTGAALELVRVSVDKEVVSELPPRTPSPPVIVMSAHPYAKISPQSASFNEENDWEEEKDDTKREVLSNLPVAAKAKAPVTQRDRSSIGSGSHCHWPRTPFKHAFEPVPAYHLAPNPYLQMSSYGLRGAVVGTTARRTERRQGWSGEWNQPDMQAVIEKLRNM